MVEWGGEGGGGGEKTLVQFGLVVDHPTGNILMCKLFGLGDDYDFHVNFLELNCV